MVVLTALACLSLLAWIYLAAAPGRFWYIDPQLQPDPPGAWPDVVSVIPARNEADGIADTLSSLFNQDYPGSLRIVLVDDHSNDDTASLALECAARAGKSDMLTLVAGGDLPGGWTGKVWAMEQGIRFGIPADDTAAFVLFSDADIAHAPDSLRTLVSLAEAGPCDLISLMVRLRCQTFAERLMIPAFVFFFRMIYPFRRINDPGDRMAGAAGGVMLVRKTALERIGGLSAIRGELIDDCALGKAIKAGGRRIWVGLSADSVSTRGYGRMSEILHMVARTAYTQLGYSAVNLVGCLFGLILVYLAPPALIWTGGAARLAAACAWILMTLLFLPMVRFYRIPLFYAALLPLTAAFYVTATLLSAWRYHRGRGGQWKGRTIN